MKPKEINISVQVSGNHLSRSFLWHNATQFLGALNDNLYRWLMVLFLIGLFGQEKAAQIGAWAAGIFVIPFLLFTPYAGILADRFSKRDIIVLAKIAELVIMALGLLMFLFKSAPGLYFVLFLMCTQSAFFGPSKYGIIPELVRPDQLSKANGFLEGMTYLAIVLGSAAAPILILTTNRNYPLADAACILAAAVGVFTSLQIEKTPAGGQSVQASILFFKDIWRTLKAIRSETALLVAMAAAAYFLFLGAFAQINLIPYGLEICKASEELSALLFVVASLAIGLGSYLSGKLSGRSIELGIVPIGGLMMAAAAIALGLVNPNSHSPQDAKEMFALNPGIFSLTFLFGVGAGLFIIPIHAFIQMKAPAAIRGQVLAASNFLSWVGVLLASVLVNLCTTFLKISPSWMFLLFGLLTAVLAVGAVIRLPYPLLRFLAAVLTRLLYRLRVFGAEHIPASGPALLVSNHVSWADAVILMASLPRPVRFLMDKSLYQNKGLHWLFRLVKAIPVSPSDSPKSIFESIEQARRALQSGELVCVFPEGGITRTGQMNRFRPGFEKIAEGLDIPVIPAYLGGIWGSVLSHYHGRLLSAWPKRLPYPVQVHFGEPLPPDTSAEEARQAIAELSCNYFESRKPHRISLGETFVRSARKHFRRPFISDISGKRLTWGKTLIAAVLLRDYLKDRTADQPNIGIFLPPSVGAVCANLAVALLNKTAVNLSYAVSPSDRQFMIEQTGLKTILTSRLFLEKINVSPTALPGALFLEDLLTQFTPAQKRLAALKALFCPRRRLACAETFDADQTAVILFSSGSSGKPKGILLSHHNILSNLEGALMIFRVYPGDKLCAVLPLFHSFGLTCTLWLPILAGVPVCFVPNPLDAKAVGQTVRSENATLLFATPTFLLNYLKRCEPDDFKTLRFIIAGAEKLKIELIDEFEKKFGIRPREGYGTTECSPLIAINVPDVEVAGARQIGTKDGTAGHPLPGIAVKILHPETGRPVPVGQPGLLWVKGPNVMKGYLNLPEKTAQVLQDGWYNTGDIVTLDRDGFITITDRLSRFSKIGGEMVSHLTIEETCIKLLHLNEPLVAVTSLPDEKKGEQIVLLYVKDKVNPEDLYEKLAESDLPKLYLPKRENLIGLDEIPRLGSGKTDILRLRQLAREFKEKQSAGPDPSFG
ncbi:MAG TPA: acyl-[ACP]--phospholipid O-acyltransferase [Anaerohalosphaeraceae bacterium]|nr:acyl-[ACP]--phospholipid O-acyltransferase [Anaerohalosphaeraceae bacterium]